MRLASLPCTSTVRYQYPLGTHGSMEQHHAMTADAATPPRFGASHLRSGTGIYLYDNSCNCMDDPCTTNPNCRSRLVRRIGSFCKCKQIKTAASAQKKLRWEFREPGLPPDDQLHFQWGKIKLSPSQRPPSTFVVSRGKRPMK